MVCQKFVMSISVVAVLAFVFIVETGSVEAANTLAAVNVPTVDRVDPPDWWVGSSVNPVRVLLHGDHLNGATVTAVGAGMATSNVKVSANGHYAFVDVAIAPHAKPGARELLVTTAQGSTKAKFAVTAPLPTAGRFQGFSPDDVVYEIMPDRFSDGDAANDEPPSARGLYGRDNPHLYHGGDFQGIADRLPYLKELGVTAIWITPIYENNHYSDPNNPGNSTQHSTSDYHGYGAINQYGVEPHFGDLASLRSMVDKAHALGIKVIQDQVANHVGQFHPWVNDPPTATWFNGSPTSHDVNTYKIWTVMDPHATPAEQSSTLGGWFANVLADLNQNDPEVARYEIQNTLWWIEHAGFDGVREDTMPYVPRAFWQRWNAAIKREFPHVNAVGEVDNGDVSLVSYFQGGRVGPDGIDTGMDSLFDYPVYWPLVRVFAQGASFTDLATEEAHDWLFPNAGHLMTFLGNHDVKRFSSQDGATAAGLMLAQTFVLTNRGIPLLYYGDEIGMTGGDDPDNRRDFPGGFPGDSRSAFTADGRTPQQQQIWQHVQTLTSLRASCAPLRRGAQINLYLTDKQWAYARVLDGNAAIVVLNNDSAPATVTMPVSAVGIVDGATLTDRVGASGTVTVIGGSVTVTVAPQSGAVFTR